ncbi:MAG: hypothetical protein WC471_03820 [Candidatus Woesearchaeota archaeon]
MANNKSNSRKILVTKVVSTKIPVSSDPRAQLPATTSPSDYYKKLGRRSFLPRS